MASGTADHGGQLRRDLLLATVALQALGVAIVGVRRRETTWKREITHEQVPRGM
jgi:hypothetical protein